MSEHLKEEQFVVYLDARLEAGERAALDRHLAACPDCRARLDGLRAVMGVLGEWNAVEPSAGFDARLRARLAEEPSAAQPWYALRPAYAVALAAAIVLAFGLAFRSLAPPDAIPAPRVARQTQPPATPAPQQVAPTPTPTSPTAAQNGDELAALDNPVLLENYDLLKDFDVLFEPIAPEEKKSL